MFKNQYLITNKKLSNSYELQSIFFNNLYVYLHPSLNISTSKNQSTVILLLGYIIDPFNAQKGNDDIVNFLVERCDTKEALFNELQSLSGRFILLYKNDSDFIALSDVCALKQLYYGFQDQDIFLTSSPKMFLSLYGIELKISSLKQNFINLNEYKLSEFEWYGDKCIDDRLMKLLPNHFLDIQKKKVLRIPIFFKNILNERDTIEYASSILQGSINAITQRYNVIQPLTAGWDSRLLLAASKKFIDKIQFYIFDHWKDNSHHADIRIPKKLSSNLGLNFQVLQPEKLNKNFLANYRREHIFSNILPKTSDIQYHYYNHSDRNIIRVNGVGGGIIKCFFGYTKHKITPKILISLSGYSGKSEYINHEIHAWFNDAKKYAEEYRIPLLDLFHWEQKTAHWAASYAFEQDIAIEEFCPLYNKNFLLSVLRINPKKRSNPNCLFFRRLINYLWDDALAEPINPAGFLKYLRKLVKRNAMVKYYKSRIHNWL